MLKELPPPLVRVLTVNVHKGYTALRRRFMLHELRAAVRAVGSDLVFLQEVIGPGAEDPTPPAWRNDVQGAHYEFLADQIWTEHA